MSAPGRSQVPIRRRFLATAAPGLCAGAVLLGLGGCQTSNAAFAAALPARLLAPGPACLEALTHFAAKATGKPVPALTQAAFAEGDTLWLLGGQARDDQGRLRDGRSTERPEILHLTREASGLCTVTHAASRQQAALPSCACASLSPPTPTPAQTR